ncbi:MAG: hypothetical protein ACU0FT_09610, partial [Paracoccus sp. (in: a-proteobacteria)]
CPGREGEGRKSGRDRQNLKNFHNSHQVSKGLWQSDTSAASSHVSDAVEMNATKWNAVRGPLDQKDWFDAGVNQGLAIGG